MNLQRTTGATAAVGLALALLVSPGAGPASAGGVTHVQLMKAGWDCFSPAPAADPDFNQLVHCAPPGTLEGFLAGTAPSARFITFDTTSLAVPGPMLGTERNIRGDLYAGQPCNTDPDDGAPSHGRWSWIYPIFGLDYYTCHNFDSPW